MIIKNGTVITEYESKVQDIRIKDGIIVEVGENLTGYDEIIDATGKYVLPGGIDAHTHMDLDVGIVTAQDDFYTGTVAAACGGTTTIVDHLAFGPKGCSLDHQIDHYHDLAKDKAVIDYSFHGVIQHVDDDVLKKMESLIDNGITSYKAYMTYDYKLSDDDLLKILKRAKELGIMIAVHAEADEVVKRRHDYVAIGLTDPIFHAKSRPAECEADAVERVIEISKRADDAPLYIVHVSNHKSMEYIKNARQDGMKNLYAETCPQYLFLNEDYYRHDDGIKYILSPPLRSKDNNALLWQSIINKNINTIGTDHCPFDYELKLKLGKDDFTKCPNGLPGVETRIPLMFSYGVQENRISINRFAEICATNPAKLFGMYPKKGVIRKGSDADIIIIDPNDMHTIAHADLHENVDFTPYEGIGIMCKIDTVISRGDVIVKNNKYLGQKGRGQFIKRQIPTLNL